MFMSLLGGGGYLTKEEVEKRAKKRKALNLSQNIPVLWISGIPKRSGCITTSFWKRDFHLNSVNGNLALVEPYLTMSSGNDISILDYMAYANLDIQQMTHIIFKTLSALTFYHCRDDVTAIRLTAMDQNEEMLLSILKKQKEGLRGLEEGSVIVCAGGKSFIRATQCVGYIPSVSTSHVTYPNAIYRERDLDSIIVDSGDPVVVDGSTREIPGYPTQFIISKALPKKRSDLLWPVNYEVIKGEI